MRFSERRFKEGISTDEELFLLAQELAKEDPKKKWKNFSRFYFKNEFCKFFDFLIGELSEEEHAHIAQRIGLSLFRRLAPRLGLTLVNWNV